MMLIAVAILYILFAAVEDNGKRYAYAIALYESDVAIYMFKVRCRTLGARCYVIR